MVGSGRTVGVVAGALVALALAPAAAPGTERYVAPNGQASGDCPPTTPCTFEWAFKDRPPVAGDELILAPGTYSFNAFPLPVASVRVRAASPAERPVFQLNGTSALFNAGTDVSDVTFTGDPPGDDALLWTGRRTKRVEVRSSGAGINIGNSDTVLVDSLVAAAGPAIELQDGTEGILIRGTTAIATGSGAFGIHVPASQSGMMDQSSDADLNSVIARGPGGDLAGTVDASDPGPTATITARRSNYRTTAGGSDLTFVDAGANQTSVAETSDAAVFVNAGAGNYRLASDSPAIDAGELTFDNGAFDLDAGPRTLGAAMDIGAFEAAYVPPPVPPVLVPETELTKSPKRKVTTRKKRVRLVYKFASSLPGSSFECAFRGSGFKPCSSPFRKRVKATRKAKRYVFEVRAISDQGVVDPSPARKKTKVKRGKR